MSKRWDERTKKIAEIILKHHKDDGNYDFTAVKQELPDIAKSTISRTAKTLRGNNWLIPGTGTGTGNGNNDNKAPPLPDDMPLPKKEELRTTEPTEAAYIQFVSKVETLPMTPDIFIGYMCAIKRGFKGNLGQWLALASRDFWFGRGINPYHEVSLIGSSHSQGQGG